MWTTASALLLLAASLHGHPRGNLTDPGGEDKEPRKLRLQDLGDDDKDRGDLHLQDLDGVDLPHSNEDEDPAQVSCGALQEFRKSPEAIMNNLPCQGVELTGECATKSMEVLKKCLRGLDLDEDCIEKVFEAEQSDEGRKCFCGGLAMFSGMLHTAELMICSGERDSRLFFTSYLTWDWLTGTKQTPTKTFTTKTATTTTTTTTQECSGLIKSAVGALDQAGTLFRTFLPRESRFVVAKYFTLTTAPAGGQFVVNYRLSDTGAELYAFRAWQSPATATGVQFFDAGTTPALTITVGSPNTFTLTVTSFNPAVNDVIEFDVKYSGPVEFNLPIFSFLQINGVTIC